MNKIPTKAQLRSLLFILRSPAHRELYLEKIEKDLGQSSEASDDALRHIEELKKDARRGQHLDLTSGIGFLDDTMRKRTHQFPALYSFDWLQADNEAALDQLLSEANRVDQGLSRLTYLSEACSVIDNDHILWSELRAEIQEHQRKTFHQLREELDQLESNQEKTELLKRWRLKCKEINASQRASGLLPTSEILERLDRIESLLTAQQEKPLNIEDAAKHLDISTSHLYKLTSSGRVPHYKPAGKRIYFLKSDLNAYLLQHRIKSKEEIDRDAATYTALNP